MKPTNTKLAQRSTSSGLQCWLINKPRNNNRAFELLFFMAPKRLFLNPAVFCYLKASVGAEKNFCLFSTTARGQKKTQAHSGFLFSWAQNVLFWIPSDSAKKSPFWPRSLFQSRSEVEKRLYYFSTLFELKVFSNLKMCFLCHPFSDQLSLL